MGSYSGVLAIIMSFFTMISGLFGAIGGGNKDNNNNTPAEVPFVASVEQGEIFAKGAKTDSAHASTVLLLPDGRVMSAWFGGSGEGNKDVRIWFALYESGDWTEPEQIPSEDTVAHWNPVLQDFGTFARCYYKVGKDTANWVTKFADYNYADGTWTDAQELVAGDTTGGRGPVRNKILVTSKGLFIAGASTEQGDWKAFFDISEDGGKTWKKTDFIKSDAEMIQPTLWEDADGIHALFRTKKHKIYRSDSTDGGYTWSEAKAIDMPNNNSGIDLAVMDNGYIFLSYNPISTNGVRNKLMLTVSKDGGNTWEDVQMLEESANLFAEFSYPALVADGNKLFVTYTYKREIIKYAFFEFNLDA